MVRRTPLLRLSPVSNHLPFLRLQKPRLDKNKLVHFVSTWMGDNAVEHNTIGKVGEKEENFQHGGCES